MDLQIPIQIPSLPHGIRYGQKIMLMGSCFTEHIGDRLAALKFDVMQNPHGILFDPQSVSHSINSYIDARTYTAQDLVYFNELWQSWHHHGRFSGMQPEAVLENIQQHQTAAHKFLKESQWLVITLGSSFSYRLTAMADTSCNPEGVGAAVANCHRAPSQWFQKYMMSIDETHKALEETLQKLWSFNPTVNILFTISPVRHIRDGIAENNRSKARLIEVVHQLVDKFDRVSYFPAYELVIDVLRDYRFYDIDLVHPNYAATRFVMDHFMKTCVDPDAVTLSELVQQIVTARNHKAFQPATQAHQKFLQVHKEKAERLMKQHPMIDLREEIDYFIQEGHTS